MKYSFSIFIFLFGSLTFIFSQEYKVSGRVLNSNNEAVVFANVLLYNTPDSSIVKGTSTDDLGRFFFDDIKAGNHVIKASYIENVSNSIGIKVSKDTDVGDVIISETEELEEVVVTYKQPRLERKVDRLIFNVENTALSDNSLWDLLKHTPSVNDIQGVLTIKGSSDVTVMINSRKINLPQNDIINLLAGSSASNVKSIEVITNPPSKYSAEGGMIIDIKMSKNLIAGYNGGVFNRYKQGVYAKHTLGTDHYFKGNKSDFSLNYSYSRDKNIRRHIDIVNFFEEDNTASTWVSNQDYLRRIERHSLSAYYNYQFNMKSSLSLATINSWNPNNSRLFDTETTIENTTDFNDFNTLNISSENTLNTSFYADYVQKLGKKNEEFSIGTHYTFYKYGREQALTNDFLDIEGNILSSNNLSGNLDNSIELYSVRFDYEVPIGKMNLETGFRYAGITSESNNEQNVLDMNQLGVELVELGKFNYNESIYAAYVGLDGKKGKWIYKGGLRAEYTNTRGIFDSERPNVKNEYLKLFPSFSLQYSPSSESDFRLWYYRRITRPRFVIANPFQYFQTNNSVFEGNPNILPSTRHYAAASYNFAKNYTVEVYYRNQNNPIRQLVLQNNEAKTLLFQQANFTRNISYGIDFIYDQNIANFWNTYVSLSGYNRTFQFVDDATEDLFTNDQLTWSFQFKNNFTFLEDKSLFVDLSFYHYAEEPIANTIRDDFSALSITARKLFWNKKASISVGLEDVFNQGNTISTRRYSDQDNVSDYRFESRLFTFGFRYRFGNRGIKGRRKNQGVEERRRI